MISHVATTLQLASLLDINIIENIFQQLLCGILFVKWLKKLSYF